MHVTGSLRQSSWQSSGNAWPELRIHEAFAMVVDRQPSAPAIVSGAGIVTYIDLDRKANALAHCLLAHGIEAEEAVGVLTERSEDLPVAFLAVLKAGGVYVPMGASLPGHRLVSMAEQSRMRCIIALDGVKPPEELLSTLKKNAANKVNKVPTTLRPEEVSLSAAGEERPDRPGRNIDIATVLFTSGSTGEPKGVLLQHDACTNLAYGHITAQKIGPDDRMLLAAAPGFIMGFRELCLPLLAGAAIVPASRELQDDPAALLAMMSRHKVSVAMFTPSYLRLFETAVPSGLRCILTAGERANADDARAYARKLDYWNIHGATEVCGTFCMAKVDPDESGVLPSGTPFANTQVYLLEADGKEVSPGAVGEIYVCGAGVARGYLHRPELTADRFVETRYGRAFRTHDLGRWNDEGQLEFVGRDDDLVKVSGQAVSLGEVEQALAQHGSVNRAVAVQHEGKLIAFVECSRTTPNHWNDFLAKTLPAYMLPAQVIVVPKMPMTSYGKVDRKALTALAKEAVRLRLQPDRGTPPQNETERKIAAIWEEVLGVRPILREDNFFALGGTSLLSIAVSQRLQAIGHVVLPQMVLVAGTVAGLAEKIATGPAPGLAVPPVSTKRDVATAGQEDFWIASKLGLVSSASQVTRVFAVHGDSPGPERWQSAWKQVLARHPALRAYFYADIDGKVFWRTADLNELGESAQISVDRCGLAVDAERLLASHCTYFRLSEAPLARAGLIQITEGPGEVLFWFTLHHSIADGLSAHIVQEELYSLLLERQLPPVLSGIAQASQAERQYLLTDAAAHDRTWWQRKLDALATEDGGKAYHEFVTDRRRPETPSGKASPPIVERLDPTSVAALNSLAKTQQVGLHAILMALLAAETWRRDTRETLVLGSGISVRPPGAERSVGHFVNLLPVVLTADKTSSLADQVRMAQSALSEVMEHGSYPSGLLYREFRQRHANARPHSRTSLCDIALTAIPSRTSRDREANFYLTPRDLPGAVAHPSAGLDLHFSYEINNEDGLELTLLWDPDVYEFRTAQAWLHSVAAWARWLAQDLSRVNRPLPTLQPEEEQLLAQWERGPSRARPAKRFHELFESVAEQQPDRAAVVGEAGTQSYVELDRKANRIAQDLLARGISREEPVAVFTECSADLPAAMLGIWKAGGAYLPLPCELPPERLAYMATDSGVRDLIVLDGHVVPAPLAQAVQTIIRPEHVEADVTRPAIVGTPQDLAYIIYTSGTTGVPKGVLVQHDGLVNTAYNSGELFGLTADDRFSLVASPGFDASVWELCGALLHGMALVPISRALRDDPWALKRHYRQHGVTVAFHAPSYLRLSKETPFNGLRVLIAGGEPLNHDDVLHYATGQALWHAYGPTEACIFVCAELVSPDLEDDCALPVGRPLPNLVFSIRRENGELAAPGVTGEVWLGGAGLSRGYLHQPEVTSQRFVQTPQGRFYRTGDLGRWTEDGLLQLLGRVDDQIKLHGQRVELGEIEHALVSHPSVEQAAVLVEASAKDTKTLRAFVRLRTNFARPSENEWDRYLSDHLPQHMVPASVTAVPTFPLTIGGKIDRHALLLTIKEDRTGARTISLNNKTETQIAAIWRDLFGMEVSREDNFFALGGNSLLAITMAHHVSQEFEWTVSARELFAAPTLGGFAQRLSELLRASLPTQKAQAPAKSALATEGQREFWTAEAAGLDTRTFTIAVMRTIDGPRPSMDQWNKAWADLLLRHEALRTFFREDEERRLHRATVSTPNAALEVATRPDRSAARAYARQRQSEAFVMGKFPLWRAGLVSIAASNEQLFWLALHHSIGDGQSVGIMMKELSALLGGKELLPLVCDFAESAAREESYLASPAATDDARYWRTLLASQPAAVFDEAPLDFGRSVISETGKHRLETCLAPAVTEELKRLARQHDSSLHAVILTLLAVEARRRTGREDVLIGTAASNRETADEADIVGYYVNMLPVPCRVLQNAAFGDALRETQRMLASALQHGRYPFARIYRNFWNDRPEQRHPARYPIFDIAITENPRIQLASSSLRLGRYSALKEQQQGPIAYELTAASPGPDFVLTHEVLADNSLLLEMHVNASLYKKETAVAWFEGLTGWAKWLAADRRRPHDRLPQLLPHEAEVLERWEHGARASRPSLRFEQLFEKVVDAEGKDLAERPAILTQAKTITYAALEREANLIANTLLSRGAAPGCVVAVLTDRSANLPAAVLGIWKAGAIYLPLAADLPAERLTFMARDAGAVFLIALDGLAVPAKLERHFDHPLRPEKLNWEHHALSQRPKQNAGPGDPAYILYTSGSTGQPKGTLVSHRAYLNTLLGAGEILRLAHEDRCLMFASPSFDVSLSDMGLPLAFGATLCPVPHEVISSPRLFLNFLSEFKITVADITPTYLQLLDGAQLPSLRILVTGGEAPFATDVKTYAERLDYFNAYGPTENTITSVMGKLSHVAETIVAGRPLPNTSVHVRDRSGNAVPPGVTGELWLGGDGLACGYVNRPDLTASAFVETAQCRLYRTGDLGRWTANGEIEVLGRTDEQLKLNGIRVELGEIEHVLSNHPDVAQAVALVDGSGMRSPSLWAFVRLHPGREGPTDKSWDEYLSEHLPAYMVPSAIITVPEVPRSNSGKADKPALKKLLAGRSPRGTATRPQTELEVEVARIWSELLGCDAGLVHGDSNFFGLGGHSLLAIAVAHRLEKKLGHAIPARELFAEPTLGRFAERISQLSKVAVAAEVLSDRATEGQHEFWTAEHAGLDTRSFNIPLVLVAHGKVPPANEWLHAWAALVMRHGALRTVFYEGTDGILYRSVLTKVDEILESIARPDLDAAMAHIRQQQAIPFAMQNAPLWRAGLVHVTDIDRHLFWLAVHHAVADGTSLGVIVDELSTLLRGEGLPVPAGNFGFAAGREETYLAGPASREDARHWQKVLASLGNGSPDVPQPFDEWPLDSPRFEARTTRNAKGAHSFRLLLDPATSARLRNFAQRNGASLHALMMTILAEEVRRRTGRPEFFLGTAASTRDAATESRVVSYFVNMLPVPCQANGRGSFEQSLQAMQRDLAQALHHARYPFARMYRDFRQHRAETPHPGRYPIFDLAVMENSEAAMINAAMTGDPHALHFSSFVLPSDECSQYERLVNAPPQDMVLSHQAQANGSLVLHFCANAAIYEKETVGAWFDSLVGWAHFLTEGKRFPGSPLPLLLPQEELLLAQYEQGPKLPHPAPTLMACVEHWANNGPQRPALVFDHGRESYSTLNARSNALAHALLAHGVTHQGPVGVLTGRSPALPEVVLAIWKAGACYVPLASDLPAERLALIVRDAGIRILVVLDRHELPSALASTGCEIFRPETLTDEFFSNHVHTPTVMGSVTVLDLACILYTSGSTGTPKGVMLHHQGLTNLGVGMVAALDVHSDDTVAMIASPAFDAWIADLACAWTTGAAAVPFSHDEISDLTAMQDKMARLGTTVAAMTPSYLRLFQQRDFPTLRLLLTVGEPPHLADAHHYAAKLRYMNGYGPTENSVATCFGEVAPDTKHPAAGRPLANTSIHIRDNHGQPVPPGTVGMIWLGGMGLALGYLGQPDLTAASFVETPAGRLYCTGDLGRWTRSGELQIIGRSDEQIKLRGQRVELGEIEHKLTTHPGVKQAVAAVEKHSDGKQTLFAFVCLHPAAEGPSQKEWRDHLAKTLPGYMLPSAVLKVATIPVTPTGKADRAALLRMVLERGGTLLDQLHTPPYHGTEQRIAEVWAEHLQCRSISREDNFFDLGGDSLRVIAVINQLRHTFDCAINDLYEHPCLAEFAAVCRPRPEHLRALIQSAAQHWRDHCAGLEEYEKQRNIALTAWRNDYETRNRFYELVDVTQRRDYRHVLLTGATGYLGSYLLKELLADQQCEVTALVRGSDDQAARTRLSNVLVHYFGAEKGAALGNGPRLKVLAGDLRRDDLGLSLQAHGRLAENINAIFHCAANVRHFGHYWELHADNVTATKRLLQLAAQRPGGPADFHFVSTLSVCGEPPQEGFRLFTEYDPAPDVFDSNYYVRTKQEAERLVIAARQHLVNACIHRVGNIAFSTDGGPLQLGLENNVSLRQTAAFLRLGVVPKGPKLCWCHVDLVARGTVLLAGAAQLTNETHHIENSRQETWAGFVSAADGVRTVSFDAFLERLEQALDDPQMDAALMESLENFQLYRGVSPQSRMRRQKVVSDRTQALLARLGIVWPSPGAKEQAELLQRAAQFLRVQFSKAA